MAWVYIENIAQHVGESVEIRGWVYHKRSSGKVRFLLVRDGTGIIQATIFSSERDHPLFKPFDALTQESSVIVRGKVREEKRAPGGFELGIEDMETVQIAQDYPITPKEHSTPFSRCGPRSSRQSGISSTAAASG